LWSRRPDTTFAIAARAASAAATLAGNEGFPLAITAAMQGAILRRFRHQRLAPDGQLAGGLVKQQILAAG
jgi:hypothetical protein